MPSEPGVPARVAAIDAFRGLVMTLMLAEVMRLSGVSRALPESAFWRCVAFHTSHVAWQGASLHDLIQPGFSFLAGASLPFSIAARRARGAAFGGMWRHALVRSAILVLLGIFLRSMNRSQTNFTFEDTLSQIGLGYPFLFLLGFASWRAQAGALVAILGGYWAAFMLYPAPGPGFDYAAAGVPPDWPHHASGLGAHFNKNSNLAWAFDTWFLNLFPRERPFAYNSGGYATLSFIPTLGTMLLGLLSGEWLAAGGRSHGEKTRGLAAAGGFLIAVALAAQWSGLCPIVKRIWTPAFTLYSGGLVVWMLAAFYAAIEWKGWRRWAFPLVVVGMNSIAAYVMSWTMEGFLLAALTRHFGRGPFEILGPAFEPVLRGAAVMAVFWGILYWMYRRRIFLRV